jgi:choline dehydrogenase-like flavoprotein
VDGATAETIACEAVVIGSGAGGAPVAAALAAAGLQVVLLEAGAHVERDGFTGQEAAMTARLWKSDLAADSAMALYAGRCVGGSTVINDAVCLRTPPEVLDAWRTTHGLSGFSDAEFGPWLDRAWQDLHAEATGPEHLNRNAQVLARGAARLGWAAQATARNVRDCVNLGLCNLGCPSNAKQSTLLTYVPRAVQAGARLIPNARVSRILHADHQVRGVDVERLDPTTGAAVGQLRVTARVVCLAAGVLDTPALLLRSGLAGAERTAGAQLQFHSSTHVTARFPYPIHGYYGPTMAFAVDELSDVHGHRGPGVMIENTAAHPLATVAALPGIGAEHERVIQDMAHLARALVLVHDRARGELTVNGRSTKIRYTPGPDDWERFRQGMLGAAELYLAAGATEVYLPLHGFRPVRQAADLAELRTLPLDPTRFTLLYAVHLFGGAVLGSTPARGFCREDGRAWDTEGLYVSDAASLPSSVGVNPQITIIANALRIGNHIIRTQQHG